MFSCLLDAINAADGGAAGAAARTRRRPAACCVGVHSGWLGAQRVYYLLVVILPSRTITGALPRRASSAGIDATALLEQVVRQPAGPPWSLASAAAGAFHTPRGEYRYSCRATKQSIVVFDYSP